LFRPPRRTAWTVLAIAASAAIAGYTYAQQQPEPRGKTSYLPVDIAEPFASIMARMVAAKPQIEKEHMQLRHRSELLDPNKADPDMADELVRKKLGLVRPDEVIVPLD